MQYNRERNSVAKYKGETKSYMVHGRKYTFIRVHAEGGLLRGYSPSVGQFAWLMDKYFQFDDGTILVSD